MWLALPGRYHAPRSPLTVRGIVADADTNAVEKSAEDEKNQRIVTQAQCAKLKQMAPALKACPIKLLVFDNWETQVYADELQYALDSAGFSVQRIDFAVLRDEFPCGIMLYNPPGGKNKACIGEMSNAMQLAGIDFKPIETAPHFPHNTNFVEMIVWHKQWQNPRGTVPAK